MKLCECGCGEPAPIAKKTVKARGYITGRPQRFRVGHRPPKDQREEKNNAWKGKAVSRRPLHAWLDRHYEKTGTCQHCGRSARTDWANLSGEYRRDRADYIELCRSCHFKMDDVGRNLELVHVRQRAQTHCKRGHEFTPANTERRPNGTRACLQCRRLRRRLRTSRERRARQNVSQSRSQSALPVG